MNRNKNLSPPETLVTVSSGNPAIRQQVPLARVRQKIHRLLMANQFVQAGALSSQLIEQLPADPWPNLITAEILLLRQEAELAMRHINGALEIAPENPPSLVIKSRICLQLGRHDEARQLLDEAIDIAPDHAKLYNEKAELLSELGMLEECREALQKSLELNPRNAAGIYKLSKLTGISLSQHQLTQTEFLLDSDQFSFKEQIEVHFALANVYAKLNAGDKHFAHLTAGNEKKNRTLDFDPEYFRREAKHIGEIFSGDFPAQLKISAASEEKIIFIVGFPRCGSTLIEQILSSHPRVTGAGEIFALRHSVQAVQQSLQTDLDYPLWIQQASADQLQRIADLYLDKTRDFRGTEMMTDKLLNNYKYIGLIRMLFPQAIIVHAKRNPVDVCYSCYKNLFNLSAIPYSYSLDNLSIMYRLYAQTMRHWYATLPGTIHTVEYESLVGNQEQVTRDLLAHCGLDWNDACLNFQRNERSVVTSSSIQVRQRLYPDSVGSWKPYKDHLGPLLDLADE